MLQFAPEMWCQIISGLQPPSAQSPRTVSGVVINSVTGQPIARALVQVGQRAMLTDGEGQFEFSDITDYGSVSAMKPGYFSEDVAPLVPLADQGGSVEVRLIPEAIVSGHVTDSDGNPLAGIPVMLWAMVAGNGLKHWEQRNSAMTNAEGEFRIAELQAGDYALRTMLKLDGPPEGEAAAGYAPVDYPVIGADGAGALHVHAGDQLQADLSTNLEKLYPVSFATSGLPEAAFPFVTIRSADGTEINAPMQRNPETGEFTTFLPSGSYEFRAQGVVPPASHSREIPLELMGSKLVTVAQAPVKGVRIAFESMATLEVEIDTERINRKSSGEQAPTMGDLAQPVSVSLVPAQADASGRMYPGMRMGDPARAPDAQKDAPLLIRNVPPGKYMLQAQPQGSWYVASAFCGGTDLTREPLAITGSAAGCTIRIVLRDDSASLKVSTPQPREATYIYAIPVDNLTRDVQTFSTRADGTASLDSIAPGEYLLLASRHPEELAFRDAQALHHYESEGKRIDVAPGSTVDVQLDVIGGDL